MAISAETKQQIEEIEPFEAAAEIEGGDVVLIDTREPHEYQEAHLEGGKLVPPGLLARRDRRGRARQVGADDPLLPQRQPLLQGGRAAAGARLRERRLDGGRHPRLAGAGAAGGRAPSGMTAEQRDRYSRHTLLPEVGVEGQLKLLNAKVLLIGAGGLGAPTALYLAAAGIGTLGLVDDDVVDASNLQRQVIHNTERIGMPKTESARLDDRGAEPRRRGRRAQRPARRRATSSRSSATTT